MKIWKENLKDEEKIFSTFRDSTKRNIRKAIKQNVEVQASNSLDSLREYYRLHCITRKRHGLPPQPFYYFEEVYKHILSKNNGTVVLALHDGKVIAGAVFFQFGRKAIFKYGASDKAYDQYRPSNLVMWHAIRWYAKNGYTSLCFGKSEPNNYGLLQFKDGWGTLRTKIKYYRYELKKQPFFSSYYNNNKFVSTLYNKLPISMLKILGNILYRHVG